MCAVLNKENPDPDLIYKSVVAEPIIRNFENRLDVINNKRKKGLWADIVSHIFGGFIHLYQKHEGGQIFAVSTRILHEIYPKFGQRSLWVAPPMKVISLLLFIQVNQWFSGCTQGESFYVFGRNFCCFHESS